MEQPGDLRYPKNWNEKLFRMLNDDVIRIKCNLRSLAEAKSDIKENQRKLGQYITYYECAIPNLVQKKSAFAATLATFDNMRIDMDENFRLLDRDVPEHLLADLEKKRKDLEAKATSPRELDNLLASHSKELNSCLYRRIEFAETLALYEQAYWEQQAFHDSLVSKLENLKSKLPYGMPKPKIGADEEPMKERSSGVKKKKIDVCFPCKGLFGGRQSTSSAIEEIPTSSTINIAYNPSSFAEST